MLPDQVGHASPTSQIIPFVRINSVVVKLFGSIGIADVPVVLTSHRMVTLLIGGHCNVVPRGFRVFQQWIQTHSLEIIKHRQTTEFQ